MLRVVALVPGAASWVLSCPLVSVLGFSPLFNFSSSFILYA
jgi:hypothetical protein